MSHDFLLGDWLIRPSRGRIERGSETVRVTPQSMRVLVCLADAGGGVVSRNEIMDKAWPRIDVTPDALSQCIVELRKAFGDDSRRPAVIETIPKVGLRLIPPVSRVEQPAPERPDTPASDSPASAGRGASREVASALQTSAAPGPRALTRSLAPRSLAEPAASLTAVMILLGAAALSSGWLLANRWNSAERDPLAGGNFRLITDFIGAEELAAISRDGELVAFLSDRAGTWDVWVGRIGTGNFRNVTAGRVPNLRNPDVRMLGFSPDGSNVEFWTKTADAAGGMIDYYWTAPVAGGDLTRRAGEISELGWSVDGERFVYHPSAPGDPLFMTSVTEPGGGHRIYSAPPGVHNHFPLLSLDGETVYFVQGRPPDEMDLWQVSAQGGDPERLTFHRSRVIFPTLLDARTLLYLATDADGSGPWLHAFDLARRQSQRIDTGGSTYTSIDASPHRRRVVVTEPHRTGTLWHLRLSDRSAQYAPTQIDAASQIQVPTGRAGSPRFAPEGLMYLAPTAAGDGLWLYANGEAKELWRSIGGRIVGGPVLSSNGKRLALVEQQKERTQLIVMSAAGSDAEAVGMELDVRGSPAWSPDGQWVAIAALREGAPRLYKIPVEAGGDPVPLGDAYALDPVWSPSGDLIVFSGVDVAGQLALQGMSVDGRLRSLPPLSLSRGSRRLAFLGADPSKLVVLGGSGTNKGFRVFDLMSGQEQALANLGVSGLPIDDFDISSDGTRIVYDVIREESDIVAIELRANR